MTGNLFQAAAERDPKGKPLAERLRPQTLADVVGQPKLLGPGCALPQLLQRGELPSMLLWGPPGSGKTTLAHVLARSVDATFESLSAVLSGIKEVRAAIDQAATRRAMQRRRTVLFIDEIHRFNKAQQDALLPHVENGVVTLIGATTENPSFEVNAALLSRCRVFVLQPLTTDDLVMVLMRALQDCQRGLGVWKLAADDDVLRSIATASGGDARRALTTLEVASQLALHDGGGQLTLQHVEQATQQKTLLYDKGGDEHYNVVSAFIKSMRGSDPDAAVYYMARMLEAGEAPRFILRRMVIFASEDIGNADPRALTVAVDALKAFEVMGLPEGVLPMTQAATYLACAPKSNAVIKAYGAARAAVQQHGALPVPHKLRNAPTSLMKGLGYGKDYKYPHDFRGHHVPESYLPEGLAGCEFYTPSDQGLEAALGQRLAQWRQRRRSAR